jgi:hypothetical protein
MRERPSHRGHPAGDPLRYERPQETVIAGKDLIAAIAVEHHRDLLTCELADQIGGNGRRITVWLVMVPDEPLHECYGIGFDDELRMVGLEMTGSHLSVRPFIERRISCHTDRKGAHGLAHQLRHQSHDD